MSNKFLKGVDLNQGKDTGYFIPNLVGEGAPSKQTEGAVGCLYMNTNNGNMYKCTAVVNGVYTWIEIASGNGNDIPPIVNTVSGELVSITDSADRPLQGLTLYGKTTQNGTPTPSVPIALESVGNSGSLTVSVMGENLLGFQNLEPTVSQGGQMEIQDGVITRTATVTVNVINIIPTELAAYIIPTDLIPGTYLYSVDYLKKPPQWLASTKAYLKVILDDGTEAKIYEGVATELTQSGVISGVCVSILAMAVGDVLCFRPQLACGTVSTAYEAYKAPQKLTINTPDGLPGIPVSGDGNYTDSNGQQWGCDEIDFARGVYVQRVYRKAFDGTETIRTSNDGLFIVSGGMPKAKRNNLIADRYVYCADYGLNMCQMRNNHHEWYIGHTVSGFADPIAYKAYLAEQFANGTPVMIAYELLTPIETPLTAEELAQYAALHTNYPNTTVMADGAGVAVTYVADTKNYIDNKIAALSAALLNV